MNQNLTAHFSNIIKQELNIALKSRQIISEQFLYPCKFTEDVQGFPIMLVYSLTSHNIWSLFIIKYMCYLGSDKSIHQILNVLNLLNQKLVL